jgi:hypothetical protein
MHQAFTIWFALLVAILAGSAFIVLMGYAGVHKTDAVTLGSIIAILIMAGMRGEFYGRPTDWFLDPNRARREKKL